MGSGRYELANSIEIRRCVDTDGVVVGLNSHDPIAVFENPQLLESFATFEWRLLELAQGQQEGSLVNIHPDMFIDRPVVAVVGSVEPDGATREEKRKVVSIYCYLDDVRVV